MGSGQMTKEAETAFRTALSLDPTHIDALHNLGISLAQQVRMRTFRTIGMSNATQGDLQAAAGAFQQVLQTSPEHSAAQGLLQHVQQLLQQ